MQNLAANFSSQATNLISAITTNPVQFCQNLLTGLRNAATQVLNQLTNPSGLQSQLYQWLVGGTSLSGLSSLNFNNPSDVTNFLLQYSGLTWNNLQNVLRQQLGAGKLAAATQIATLIFGPTFDPTNPLQNLSTPPMLSFLQNLPNQLQTLGLNPADILGGLDLTNLGQTLLNRATAQLTTSLQQAAPRLLAKFVPGAGAAISLYQGLTYLIQNQQQLADLFTGFTNSIGALANGDVSGYTTALVNTFTNAVPKLLDFAADQLGLNTLRQNLRQAISFIPSQVDQVIRRMVAAVAGGVVGALPGNSGNGNAGGLYAGMMAQLPPFAYNGRNYILWVANEGNIAKVKVVAAGTTQQIALTATNFTSNATTNISALLTAAGNLIAAIRNRTSQVQDLARLQAALPSALNAVKADILANNCTALLDPCFAAGTQLWTPQGYRNVEDIQPGEWVHARDESDPFGPIEAKLVEKKFERTGRILHLHLPNGKLIRTTPEHPFLLFDCGWTAAGALQSGNVIRTDSGWTTVEEVYDTGEFEKVYNLRVAEYHTYFVGQEDWGFAVWAHNAYQVDPAQLNPFQQALSTTLWDATNNRWKYKMSSLNMNSMNWISFQSSSGPSGMPSRDQYVYLVFNRAYSSLNLEIMKVGKTDSGGWQARFGNDIAYRNWAIAGMQVSIYAFDMNRPAGGGAVGNARTLETDVRKALWGSGNLLPYDGSLVIRNSNNVVIVNRSQNIFAGGDPYAAALRRNAVVSDFTPPVANTPLAGVTSVQYDLNSATWRNAANGNTVSRLQAGHRYIYILVVRSQTVDTAHKILKVGVTGETPNMSVRDMLGRLGAYNAYAQFFSGVTEFVYDVTNQTQDTASLKGIERQVRNSLYTNGYRQPLEHDEETDTPSWRNDPTDIDFKATYDVYNPNLPGILH